MNLFFVQNHRFIYMYNAMKNNAHVCIISSIKIKLTNTLALKYIFDTKYACKKYCCTTVLNLVMPLL